MLIFFNPIKFGITFTFGNLLSVGRFVFYFFICWGVVIYLIFRNIAQHYCCFVGFLAYILHGGLTN
ncbi:hypothetical protein Patl1_13478 [Pistacia atlantica]|uniref:Uncharacterized protein n=1 Tax=Pistacia atlantica TaxID=434234 RepID=A0ACC1ATY1_9ROSI|nr:hypothetical protein Patl1_13478 [Pistacia atlantica]